MPDLPAPPPTLLAGAALFLDFDGTLVELAETPDAILVPLTLGPLLAGLRDRLAGRLAIISGRALAGLEKHLPITGLARSGSHGLELCRADDVYLPVLVPANVKAARQAVRDFAASRTGLLVEEKPLGVALHYRQVPAAGEAARAFAEQVGEGHALVVQHGAMVVELRAAGGDKGDALRFFMAALPFAGATPLFIGDDLTDEHAFVAATAMGGTAILVGPPRETAARYRLPGVAEVAAWLEQAA